jgi:hypothetical protein
VKESFAKSSRGVVLYSIYRAICTAIYRALCTGTTLLLSAGAGAAAAAAAAAITHDLPCYIMQAFSFAEFHK